MKNNYFFISAFLVFFTMSILSCNPETKTEQKSESEHENISDLQISLAQWSLHKTFFGGAVTDWNRFGKLIQTYPDSLLQGDVDPIEFPKMAAAYGLSSIELVNVFYFSKSDDMEYWRKFKQECAEAKVSVGLIMCDRLGDLGSSDSTARSTAVLKHHQWVDIASFLGAKSIRVNAAGEGRADEVASYAVDGLTRLAEYAQTQGVNVIVENHGGYSSDAKWLSKVIESVNKENVGTLPDFGNFCVESSPNGCVQEYDRYDGIAELMPYAKGVSAKSHHFDASGEETKTDFSRMIQIVRDSGFKGYIGIEYEGDSLSEDDGIKATKTLLEKVIRTTV